MIIVQLTTTKTAHCTNAGIHDGRQSLNTEHTDNRKHHVKGVTADVLSTSIYLYNKLHKLNTYNKQQMVESNYSPAR